VKRLIITGDDFGLAVPVNEAIEIAHRSGVLSTTSLMVGAGAATDAIERARRLPTLKVGLHLVLVKGRPLLPAHFIPGLVDQHGEFHENLLAAGFRFFFRPEVRRQLEAEIHAQFAAFHDTGLPLDHVNSHNHMHLHPTILSLILKVGRSFGLSAIRLPYEPPVPSWRASRKGLIGKVASALGLAPWTWLLKARLRSAGIKANDFIFGLHDTGAMNEATVLRLLAELPEGVTEMYFHPATRRCREIDRSMADYCHEEELAALTSAKVRAALENMHLQPVGFRDL
jgi:hopanoid biosynthesis associated protein HpnK